MKTQEKAMHTKTPWEYHLGRGANPRFHIQDSSGYQVASTPELSKHKQAHEENAMREANAEFIVRAVNAHEDLRLQAVRLETMLEAIQRRSWNPSNETIAFYLEEVRQVLQKSEGKQ